MKKKIVMGILSMTLVVGVVAGCGLASKSSSAAENTSTSTEEAVTTTEYSELTVKTDWVSMAEITFSEDGMTISGSGCTDENGVLYITEGGAYTLYGSSDAASILINTDENVKLILNGVELSSTNGPVIYGSQVKNLYIEIADGTTNTLTDSAEYATDSSTGEEIGKGVISCEDDVIILGEGTLNINANHKHGISSDDKLYIEAGNINIISNGTDGINVNDLVCIDGGTITIDAVSDGIEVQDSFIINGGTVSVTSDNEGIESKNTLYINGGNITVTSVDDGINAAYYIEINDGTVTVTSTSNDAIDCNGGYDGCITINGGEVYAYGAEVPEGALDADDASVIINGGKVTASGGSNSPIIENGGENDITGSTFSGGGQGGQGGPGGNGGAPGGQGRMQGNMPEGFNPEGAPANGERPDLKK